MAALEQRRRPPAGEAAGLLVLHHGRGTDETDLLGLADHLDPGRRLLAVCPRAPLTLPGSPGYHWYAVPAVGYPDPETFFAAREALAELHDGLWEETGIPPERTVLGGFSMGAVMSYAMALGAERPPVAGILALSGFVPSVEGWEPSLADRRGSRAFIAHGAGDPVIGVELARRARELLEGAGLEVDHREHHVGHSVPPAVLAPAAEWIATATGAPGA